MRHGKDICACGALMRWCKCPGHDVAPRIVCQVCDACRKSKPARARIVEMLPYKVSR